MECYFPILWKWHSILFVIFQMMRPNNYPY